VKTPHTVESFHALNQAGVVGALREGSIRLSPHCYNTVEEIERVVDILRSR
jgi:selenocysteine lyase/cysteine desulfurase